MPRDEKLRRLPPTHKRSKRSLLRPPITTPYTNSNQPKVVYVSARTPFISAVKRVRKLLAEIEKRVIGKAALLDQDQPRSEKQKLQALVRSPSKPEAVYIRATGRAIERGLNIALYFQNQQDCHIQLKTGTAGTVDDIVEVDDTPGQETATVDEKVPGTGHDDKADSQTQCPDDLPDTQIRKTSFLEVAIWLN